MSSQVLSEFITKPKQYALLNSAPEGYRVHAMGVAMFIPSSGEVSTAPAHDTKGELIPGSVIFTDIMKKDVYGNSLPVPEWNSALAVKHALGINVQSGLAEGAYAQRGLSLITDFSPEAIAKLKADGRARWEEWQLKQAADIVQTYEHKAAKMDMLGMKAGAAPEEYHRAKAFLDEVRGKKGYAPMAAGAPAEVRAVPDDVDFITFAAQKAAESAKSVAKAEDQDALADAMVKDPEFLRLVAKKYRGALAK